jgi:Putative peptidoglycan binding domain
MKTPLIAVLVLLPVLSAFAGRGFSVSREGPNGGSVDAQGVQAGRFSAGSVSAEGPNGGTYDASGARYGRYGTASSSAQGPNGNTVNRSATWNNGGGTVYGGSFNGYRSGYVYTGGVYRPATITVNSVYIAPVGVYAGWRVMTQPYYVTYPAYATCPVEVAVQVQLKRQGYYGGAIDGSVGPMTQQAIAKYQSLNGLPPTGQINKALLKSLHIV